MATKISKKIVGYALGNNAESEKPTTEVKQDVNPIFKKIDKRPNGRLNAINEKIEYVTQEGKKKVYLSVSFLEVSGVLNGSDVTIERPIEFFYMNSDQWITASMRNLSFAARSGFLAEALQDMRNIEWTKGPVRCGLKDHGNGKLTPIIHNSEAAAMAWAIQDILISRGFLDVEGNQVPVEALVRKASNTKISLDEILPTTSDKDVLENNVKLSEVKGSQCPSCKSFAVTKQGGCDICGDCGYSRCS